MSTFKRSVQQSFKGAVKTFQTFPIAIASALAFAIVTMIRIQMDWPQQEDYNFLFNCLHLAFSTSAAFGVMVITIAQSRYNSAKAFLVANLLGVVVAVIAFVSLYLFGGVEQELGTLYVTNVSSIAAARIASVILVSIIAFIFFSGYPKEQSDFARALFMLQKAFFIALIYGVVIMSGASGVAGAIQSLLYQNMSSKVYMYLVTITGFLAFTIFVGYFPDFRKGQVDEHREVAQKQPRFIEILFVYIMVPIVLALTAVLLVWTGKILVTGSWPAFARVAGIVISYSIGGIWLHLMVTRNESGLTKFYRITYPVAALVILAFGIWALIIQLNKTGLKTQEYYFALILLTAVAAAVLLLIIKVKAHSIIAALICALTVFSVLPLVGYHTLPVSVQVSRLENLLISQGMLEGNQLVPAITEPELDIRESITDVVEYLAYAEGARLPDWFDKRLGESDVFESKLGFEQTWPEPEYTYDERYGETIGMFLMLPNEAVDISDYNWAVYLQHYQGDRVGEAAVTIDGESGSYTVKWMVNFQTGIPTLKILLDDRVILEYDMKDYIDKTAKAFPYGQKKLSQETYEDMSLVLETPEISVLLVFNNIETEVDPRYDTIYYNLDLNVLYLKENH